MERDDDDYSKGLVYTYNRVNRTLRHNGQNRHSHNQEYYNEEKNNRSEKQIGGRRPPGPPYRDTNSPWTNTNSTPNTYNPNMSYHKTSTPSYQSHNNYANPRGHNQNQHYHKNREHPSTSNMYPPTFNTYQQHNEGASNSPGLNHHNTYKQQSHRNTMGCNDTDQRSQEHSIAHPNRYQVLHNLENTNGANGSTNTPQISSPFLGPGHLHQDPPVWQGHGGPSLPQRQKRPFGNEDLEVNPSPAKRKN
ncbi:GATA zinc finger domain-containing protein 14-like [Bombina bombina]|uniref:GATA zinc finger domain-containing protein 14-like n=1 Tax=Bombina bombina TaxID=8345 RepID=UPI00235AC27B|nr:GATA zinc finger domain-containing protein 14-like [Bombina bombina]